MKFFKLFLIAFSCICCSGEKVKVSFFRDSQINIPLVATASPDHQAFTTLFDDVISISVKDTARFEKKMSFVFALSGKEPSTKIKNDLRYYVFKDTSAFVTITITHLGKKQQTQFDNKIKVDENKIFSFTEEIPCKSLGSQKYDITISIKNGKKDQQTLVEFDSWDSTILKE